MPHWLMVSSDKALGHVRHQAIFWSYDDQQWWCSKAPSEYNQSFPNRSHWYIYIAGGKDGWTDGMGQTDGRMDEGKVHRNTLQLKWAKGKNL